MLFLGDDDIDGTSKVFASLRFLATTLSTLTCCDDLLSYSAQFFRFLTNALSELVNRFSATLTEIRFVATEVSFTLCSAIGNCTAMKTLEYMADEVICIPEVIAML